MNLLNGHSLNHKTAQLIPSCTSYPRRSINKDCLEKQLLHKARTWTLLAMMKLLHQELSDQDSHLMSAAENHRQALNMSSSKMRSMPLLRGVNPSCFRSVSDLAMMQKIMWAGNWIGARKTKLQHFAPKTVKIMMKISPRSVISVLRPSMQHLASLMKIMRKVF